MAILNNSNAISTSAAYNLTNSLRFRASATATLTRTPATASNRKTWTWSGWVKRGTLSASTSLGLFGVSSSGGNYAVDLFFSNDTLFFQNYIGGGVGWYVQTSAVFRDPSAWYHIVVAIDTTQATVTNGVKLYVNGVQQTFNYVITNTGYVQNADLLVNSTTQHQIGTHFSASYFDGYMAEVNFVDGQALTPSSFGSTDAITGQWLPKLYSGTYGTNGFYLKFADASAATAAAIGKDSSSNGNNWTPSGISVTAGVTYDAMIDSPTLTSATVGNYAVLNPLLTGGAGTLSNGNLTSSGTDAANQSSFPMQTGKWYAEATLTTLGSQDVTVGIISIISIVASINNAGGYGWGVRLGRKWINGAASTGFSTAANGDIAGLAFNADSGQLDVYKNNVLVFSITGIPTATIYNFTSGAGGTTGSNTINWNFGQRPFTYTPPSGFVRLNTFNLPDSTIVQGNKVMDATTYTGTGASLSVTNAGAFKPDLVWAKTRSAVSSNLLYDSIRGVNQYLSSNQTAAEATLANSLTAFNSNGFTVGSDSNINGSGVTNVGWQWQAGQGTNTSNTSGTITSTVSVNTTAGFSVVTYTGTGANATVGHGLGVAPSWVIVKRRDTTGDWQVRHTSIAAASSIQLNSTAAAASATTVWNSTAPSSTVFSIGTAATVNASAGTYVAYCWAEIAGFSKFGSYTGNGSTDGPFVYLGFRPSWILIKSSSAASTNWWVLDKARNTYNLADLNLLPNDPSAELNNSTYFQADFLSNGFKLRSTGQSNTSAATYIYMAFAENPFKNANAR